MIEAGNMEARAMEGRAWMPARIVAPGTLDGWQEGYFNLRPWDFQSKAGRAWLDANGIFTLRVHGNLVYQIRQRAA